VEFAEAIRRRRMVRNYTGEPVDPTAVERILSLARRAPSAGFSQGQTFVVVTEAPRRRALAQACGEVDYVARGFEPWLSRAPVHVVLCVEPQRYRERYAEADKGGVAPPRDWRVPWWWVDGGQALMALLLGAVDEGLAAGLLAVDAVQARALLAMPTAVEPLGLVTIGHAAPDRSSGSLGRGRRPWADQVRWQRW
jgi:nitroreductase